MNNFSIRSRIRRKNKRIDSSGKSISKIFSTHKGQSQYISRKEKRFERGDNMMMTRNSSVTTSYAKNQKLNKDIDK